MTVLEKPLTKQAEQEAITVSIYNHENKSLWDNFVSNSKNGTFLFYRDYMEYHSDRFIDHSLMFYNKGELIAVLPANQKDGVLYSHAGLTFGGIISDYNMTVKLMLNIFETLKEHCKDQGFSKLIYKAIPAIYHSVPADEDLFALFTLGAEIVGRNVSSSVFLQKRRKFSQKRRTIINKAKRINLTVKRSYDFMGFMDLVQTVVSERYGARPVHSGEEMIMLAERFPENIKLFASFKDEVMLAGCLMYESQNVAHGQYAANSELGRTLGAQDIIIDYLLNNYYVNKKYFDLGTSTLNQGQFLNEGLIGHKESFGASSIVYDFYELPFTE